MVWSKRFWILISLIFVICALGIGSRQVWAQSERSRYFPETGHWVTDEFLLKYQSVSNPIQLFGAPITEAFIDNSKDSPTYGTKIQYFEKVRFELDPNLPINIQVKISPLGEDLYEEGQELGLTTTPTACRYFAETGYSVCYAFLDFFELNGDIKQFGYPISGFEVHDGRIVQYFQKGRLEWRPENPPGQWVTVGNLGLPHFYLNEEDPRLLNPVPQDDSIPEGYVIKLRTRAFVSSSVLPSGDSQTIYVIVQDQNYKPVPDAEVEFILTFPDGNTKEYRISNTNTAGVSKLNFNVGSEIAGITNINVTVHFQQLEGQTRTSFHIWW